MLSWNGTAWVDGGVVKHLRFVNDATAFSYGCRWISNGSSLTDTYVWHNHNFPSYTGDSSTKIPSSSTRHFWWQYFWLLNNLGLNGLRTTGAGWSQTLNMFNLYKTNKAAFFSYMTDMLDMAVANGCYVVFTFLGGFYPGEPELPTVGMTDHIFITGSPSYIKYVAWIADVMAHFKDHPGLGMWDIVNEPDSKVSVTYWETKYPDDGTRQFANARAQFKLWLDTLVHDCITQSGSHTHLVTSGVAEGNVFAPTDPYVSFGSLSDATRFKSIQSDYVDVCQDHLYYSAEGYTKNITDPMGFSAPKPLFIGECNFNSPTGYGYWPWMDTAMNSANVAYCWMVLSDHGKGAYPGYPIPASVMASIPPMPSSCRDLHPVPECINGEVWDCVNGIWTNTHVACGTVPCRTTHPTPECINGEVWDCVNGVWTNTHVPCGQSQQNWLVPVILGTTILFALALAGTIK